MRQKIAIIIGANGQDGTILTNLLSKLGYGIIAISRVHIHYINLSPWNMKINILNAQDIMELVQKFSPDELYYFPAYHHSSEQEPPNDRELYNKSREIHVDGYFNFLEAIAKYSQHTSVCYASSSLIFEGSNTCMQDEQTCPVPRSPYSITKLEGMHIGNWYASKYGIKIINAIFYNHESEFRESNFLSMKIIRGAIEISQGKKSELILGDLSIPIDQGSAWEYMETIIHLVSQRESGDYIVSSGEQHTIRDMVEIVFGYLGLDWNFYVRINPNIIKRKTCILYGNNKKILQFVKNGNFGGFEKMILDILKKIQK